MKRFALYLVFVPVAVVILLFALANREIVTLSLDPFGADEPALAFTAPLFIVLFIVLMLGVLVGGIASWLNQGGKRRALRQARAEAERYRLEADRLRVQLAGTASPQSSTQALPAPIQF
jgi:uncharacterized integral membrane protein